MRPRLLDLFCGAGGAGYGYSLAGFEVAGVDIAPQPRYPFAFEQAGAIQYLRDEQERGFEALTYLFDAIHASPPCQDYSKALRHLAHPQPRLIDPLRELLDATGLPWVIENVEGSPIPRQQTLDGRYGVELCGTSFGLRVYRHRLFESNVPLHAWPCQHVRPAMNPHNVAGRERIYQEFGRQDPEILWRDEMGVGWMNRHETREAIPPAYTEFIGHQLLQQLEAVAS